MKSRLTHLMVSVLVCCLAAPALWAQAPAAKPKAETEAKAKPAAQKARTAAEKPKSGDAKPAAAKPKAATDKPKSAAEKPKSGNAKAKSSASKKGAPKGDSKSKAVKGKGGPPALENIAGLPWSLRDHFTFTLDSGTMDYDAKSSVWQVRFPLDRLPGRTTIAGTAEPEDGASVVARAGGFSIQFEDGKTLRSDALLPGTAARVDEENHALGKAAHFEVAYPAHEGLSITHRATTFKTMPFVIMELRIANTGAQPVTVQSIEAANIAAGGIQLWEQGLQCAQRHVRLGDMAAAYDPKTPATLAFFHAPVSNTTIALGALPDGKSTAAVDIKGDGNGYGGTVRFDYAPGIVIAPGASVTLAPLWVSYGIGTPQMVDRYFAWACVNGKLGKRLQVPPMWVSVLPEQGLKQLMAMKEDATTCGIRHALIPARWEGAPGSMQGDGDRFPKNIKAAARDLTKAGFLPGITLDALSATDKTDGAVKGDGGQAWLNPGSDAGRAEVRKRVETLKEAGFQFFVADTVTPPDAVLKQMALTRSQAQTLAVAAIREAAGDLPVLPAGGGVAAAGQAALREMAASVMQLTLAGMAPAPVRLTLDGADWTDAEIAALRLCLAPVEFVGAPESRWSKPLAAALSQGALDAAPLDVANAAPGLWQLRPGAVTQANRLGAVISFEQAAACSGKQLDLNGLEQAQSWQVGADESKPLTETQIPAATALTTTGIYCLQDKPSFMGITGGVALHLDQLQDISWDEKAETLTVKFTKITATEATALFYLPEAWKVKTVSIGEKKLKGETKGQRLAVNLTPGATALEVKFTR